MFVILLLAALVGIGLGYVLGYRKADKIAKKVFSVVALQHTFAQLRIQSLVEQNAARADRIEKLQREVACHEKSAAALIADIKVAIEERDSILEELIAVLDELVLEEGVVLAGGNDLEIQVADICPDLKPVQRRRTAKIKPLKKAA